MTNGLRRLLADLTGGLWRWLWIPSLPDEAGWLAGALFMLLGAGISSQAGRGRPHQYLALAETSGRVVAVRNWSGFFERRPTGEPRVAIEVDPGGGEAPVRLEDPELSGAQARLRVLRVGQPVTARYDGQTKQIWELESMGLVVIGPADIARWQAEEHASGVRRARLLLAGSGVLALVWVVRLRRPAFA